MKFFVFALFAEKFKITVSTNLRPCLRKAEKFLLVFFVVVVYLFLRLHATAIMSAVTNVRRICTKIRVCIIYNKVVLIYGF